MKSRSKKPRTQKRSMGIARLAGILIILLFDLSAWARTPGNLIAVGNLPFPERNSVPILLPSNSVLFVGGIGISSRLTSMIRYDPTSATFGTAGDMDTPYDTATLLADGRILLAGGGAFVSLGANGTVQRTAELYDPASGTFSRAPGRPLTVLVPLQPCDCPMDGYCLQVAELPTKLTRRLRRRKYTPRNREPLPSQAV